MIGLLTTGMLVRYPDNSVWYVDHVSPSGAYVVPISGFHTEIVTSKRLGRQRARVVKYPSPQVISLNSALEVLDWANFNRADVMRRVMARKEGNAGVAELEKGETVEGAKKERAPRTQTQYVRTNKEAKEMRGQGKVVLDYMNATSDPKTVSEVAKAVGSALGGKQDPERVVGYYLTRFKKEGLVNSTKPGETAETA